MSGSLLVFVFAFYAVCFVGLVDISRAQNQTRRTTDPYEVAALNSIFQKWRVSAPNLWNISGEPCSGTAVQATDIDETYGTDIKCDCSDNNGSTCHITQLKILAMNASGIIPDELWNLTYLSNLNLGQNYLTGSLSASIGKLTRLQYLNFGANSLSGELPKELGNLTELLSLAFDQNNFSGSLPFELGNLSKLEELYIVSSGVGGEIPLTFANLQNLATVWASDIELTGRLPDFIGNWSKLTTLWIQGNSFEGPIPSTFSNLNSLNDLRISDLSDGNSSLEFIKDMKNLNILVLRNNNISDSIPSNIGEFQSLWHLDLSFNKLIGQIPDSLFNLSSLSYLILGDNKLSGTLPTQKSSTLRNIDLSYNNLSGSFPSWVSQQNLQLNLVSNNFMIEGANSSVLPSGLNCLQQNFPCNRGSPRYLRTIDSRPHTFSYSQLRTATEDFNPANLLGKGGFGPVYKGLLGDGRAVAVKQLSVASHQGKNQFVTEIATISAVQHRSLVKLYGCCIEGDKRLLVYEYLENKSLDQALFGDRSLDLGWTTRYHICFGVARGLAYLHEESRLRIVHRDIKASNILLDSNLNPKISDFGLAKLYDDQMSHKSTGVAGTIGYLAPEYALRGHLTEKVDVFGFGVVALEIVSGRPNSDPRLEGEKRYLLEWAWHLRENNREVELVDTKLWEFSEEEVKRVIGIGLLCTQTSPMLRPPMSRVVAMLSGDIEVGAVTSRPGYLTDWNFNDPTTQRMVTDKDNSPVNASGPFLDEILEEGR